MELLGEMLKDGLIKPNPLNGRRRIIIGMPGFIICIERAEDLSAEAVIHCECALIQILKFNKQTGIWTPDNI